MLIKLLKSACFLFLLSSCAYNFNTKVSYNYISNLYKHRSISLITSDISTKLDTLTFSVDIKGIDNPDFYYSSNLFILYKNENNKLKKKRLLPTKQGFTIFNYPDKYKVIAPIKGKYSFKLIGDIIYMHSPFINMPGSPYKGFYPQGKIESEWFQIKK